MNNAVNRVFDTGMRMVRDGRPYQGRQRMIVALEETGMNEKEAKTLCTGTMRMIIRWKLRGWKW